MKVVLRFVTFIPDAWIYFATLNQGEDTVYYEGDNRSFDPYTASTQRYRTAQQIEVDFTNQTFVHYENTGITTKKVVHPDGSADYYTGQASPSGITTTNTNLTWPSGQVSFHVAVDCANPLQWDAPAINYDFDVTVYSEGTVHVNGSHDGFPAYEIYKSIDGGSSWYTIDQYNPYDHGNDITALYPPEDVTLSTTV